MGAISCRFHVRRVGLPLRVQNQPERGVRPGSDQRERVFPEISAFRKTDHPDRRKPQHENQPAWRLKQEEVSL